MTICNLDTCSRPVRAKNLCGSHYQKQLKTQPKQLRHCLTEIDQTSRTAICTICGPISNVIIDKDRVRCREARRATRKSTYNRWDRYEYGNKKRIPHETAKREWDRLYESQHGACAICHKTEADEGVILCLDHCHDTGKIRGILCRTCNTGIGMLKDSLTLVKSATEYLSQ